MRPIIFYSPHFGEHTLRFVRALSNFKDAYLVGMGCDQPAYIQQLGCFKDFIRLKSVLDMEEITAVLRDFKAKHGIHALISVLESAQMAMAKIREAVDIPGLMPQVAANFRDKARMKEVLRQHGIPCADFRQADHKNEARSICLELGYPLILKPLQGEGCRATYLIRNDRQLEELLGELHISEFTPVIIEEYLEGEEGSFDTLAVNGEIKFYSMMHYFPGPLDAVRNPWVQSIYYINKNDFHDPQYDPLRAIAQKALVALGMKTSISHMEWFRRRKDQKFYVGEIAARPPGEPLVSIHNLAHGISLYHEWAKLYVTGDVDREPEPKWHVACAALRAQGQGVLRQMTGLKDVLNRYGHLVVHSEIPKQFSPKQTDGYLGEGKLFCRSQNFQELMEAMKFVITTVKLRAS